MPIPPAATSEDAVLALARRHALLRARDLAAHALPTVALTRLVAAGKLERVHEASTACPAAGPANIDRSRRRRCSFRKA